MVTQNQKCSEMKIDNS